MSDVGRPNERRPRDPEERRAIGPPGAADSQAELDLLFRLVVATSRSERIEDVYDPALDGVAEILGAERSSILLFDPDGVMRFKAWRGLSDAYRKAVEGHSPWSPDERDPKPILVPDTDRDESMAPYRPLFAEEGIRAIGFVPLVQQGRLIGKFMMYWERPRTFSARDAALALGVATHVAQAVGRARLLEEERRLREKLNVALDAGRMGVWEWDMKTGRVTWSPTLEAIHGLGAGAFPGTFEAYQRDIHAEDRDRVLASIRATLDAPREHHLEYRIVVPDGTVRWVAAHGKVLRDGDGHPVAMTGVCMDVTERKRLEAAREEALAELTRSLRFNEMFTGVLGHDLRNPLAAIMVAARLALMRGGSEKLVKPLSRILSSGDRMTRMIDQLLDFTRVRMGTGIPIEPERFDLVPLVRQAMDELDDAHPEWTLRLEHKGDAEGAWDADRLLQVFSNLVANAIQHGVPEHGVTVRVDGSAADTVRVSLWNAGAIPDELVANVFEPLAGGRQRRDGSRGLGLGLFISREIVKAHGGRIDVRSAQREGTTFTVTLPRVSTGAAP